MIQRGQQVETVLRRLRQFPVVAVLGARQVGKTTLARAVARAWGEESSLTFLDLEDPTDRARLQEPKLALEPLRGLVVLDEVQGVPELFPVLRVLADREPLPARFLILGSASPALLQRSSESLAGRVAFHELAPFDLAEVGASQWRALWLRGGFPRSFLASDDEASRRWRQAFARTYLERDLAELGIRIPAGTIRRFWTMLAHYHAQTWNGAELARAFGVSQNTVRNYLDILCGTFMARRLPPWFENPGKREVRAPKVFLTDSGVLHYLLGIEDAGQLAGHPKVGASFEGFVIQQVVGVLRADPEECFFWGVHTGAELDLLVVRGGVRLGFEVKHSASPKLTPAMRSSLETLGLERLDVIYPGVEVFPLADRVRAVGIEVLTEALEG